MKDQNHRMYEDVKTWNPFVGCKFGCTYCKPTYQRLINRVYYCQGRKCSGCFDFAPHEHRDRLPKFPAKKHQTVWACAHGDISFAATEFIKQVIEVTDRHPDRTLYWQSKNPKCFEQYIPLLSENSILLTTLETNRDEGYEDISKAPKPSLRHKDFKALKWDRKIITIEPILKFDHNEFLSMILSVNPEAAWIGYNSRPTSVTLPEPELAETKRLISELRDHGVYVKEKLMRDRVYS